MESDLQHHRHHHPQKQSNSGLARYQSAPSSYFSSFMDRDFSDEFLNRPTSPETERIFEQFLQSTTQNSMREQKFEQTEVKLEEQSQIIVNNETQFVPPQSFSYQRQNQQRFGNQNPGSVPGSGSGNRVMSTVGGSNSNLIRHSSSPAGLFNSINIEKEYAVMGGMRGLEQSTNRETSFASTSTPYPPPPSSRLPPTSWDDSARTSNDATHPKELTRDDRTLSGGLNLSKVKNIEAAYPPAPPRLVHHLSLPTSSSEMNKAEMLLDSSDSVPWKIRAKRGCATHPRSIAERVRRTRISEKLKKLQDLVPNMDKQTNTSDMLDLAVDYIKDLQSQVQNLSDSRDNCTCLKRHQ